METPVQDRDVQLAPAQEERARAIHRRSIVVDGSSVVRLEGSHIERARAGGVTATNHTVVRPMSDLPTALGEINMARRWIDANPDDVLLATSVEHVHDAKRTDREAIIFGPQNTEFIGTDLALLGTALDLGVRILQLTYQRQNWVGSGCGERTDGGLTTFGRAFVREMNTLGMVVDVSHCGQTTGKDAVAASSAPVILSHAHPNRVAPHARAKDDDLLRAIADSGGVIGITAISMFLYDPDAPGVRPGLADFARHIRYLVDLVGVDHVAIGLDFDETNTPEKYAADQRAHPEIYTDRAPFGWDDKRIHGLTHAGEEGAVSRVLVAEGLTDDEIAKVLGGNWLRVFTQVWKS